MWIACIEYAGCVSATSGFVAGSVIACSPTAGLPPGPTLDKQGPNALFPPERGRRPRQRWDTSMDRDDLDERIRALIEPFNKKNVEIGEDTTFAGDLEFDSLTVMDFVAAIEDEFDIIITMNQQAEIENYGQLVDAVCELTAE
jgi:acyl carrier protein